MFPSVYRPGNTGPRPGIVCYNRSMKPTRNDPQLEAYLEAQAAYRAAFGAPYGLRPICVGPDVVAQALRRAIRRGWPLPRNYNWHRVPPGAFA